MPNGRRLLISLPIPLALTITPKVVNWHEEWRDEKHEQGPSHALNLVLLVLEAIDQHPNPKDKEGPPECDYEIMRDVHRQPNVKVRGCARVYSRSPA